MPIYPVAIGVVEGGGLARGGLARGVVWRRGLAEEGARRAFALAPKPRSAFPGIDLYFPYQTSPFAGQSSAVNTELR